MSLVGRGGELRRIAALLERARALSGGGALLIHGAPGSGKTALLRTPAPGFLVLEAAGVEAETDLPFAAVQQVLMPLAADLDQLPPAQAAVLRRALETGEDVPRFALCVAVLNLLVLAGRRQPVLVRVDDVDVIDTASRDVLAFAARRVASANVVVLAAATDPAGGAATGPVLPGVERLPLVGLDVAAGAELIASAGLSPDVAIELVQLCAGAPLALREVAGALSVEQARGRAPLPVEFPRGSRIRRAYDTRLRALPDATRELLLLLAADPEGLDLDTVSELSAEAVDAAEASGIVHVVDGRMRFRTPLVAGSVYRGVSPERRRAVHRRIAGALGGSVPEHRLRRLWHLAAAEPSEPLARELADVAEEVRDRGDHAAASLASERAAELSPNGAELLLAAARDAWLAGRPHRAGVLLTRLRPAPAAVTTGGRRDLLRGQIELRAGSPAAAHETLLGASDRLAAGDRTAAVVALLHAGEASFLTGNLRRYVDISLRVLALREGGDPPERELMFEYAAGMMALFRGRHGEAVRRLRNVVDLVPRTDDPTAMNWGTLAALMLGEESLALGLTERSGAVARARGQLALVPRTLELATFAQLWLGRYNGALASAQEGLRLAQEAGLDNSVAFHRSLLALFSMFQGDDDAGLRHAQAATAIAAERGLAMPHSMSSWALAHRDLSAGRAADAAGRLRAVATAGGGPGYVTGRVLTAPHFVEAAVRCGDRAGAVEATELFGRWATSTGSTAARALLARCQALTATDPDDAEDAYREAIRLHQLGDSDFEHARTELLYGRELRRRRGPSAARTPLRSAHDTFDRLGATAWVEQSRAELRATGEPVRPVETRLEGALTAQQLTIARIVAEGATNREVAAQLYLSPRTVDHHMRNIFVKLGVRSRVELVRLLTG
ncbi:helix-turn-helix transcriptional regulator [Cryptosporangium arvum]|uniref:helix-turn-helix transcriptional regulator n=1 Tax=Cryptosporangium arvum TaxID=80871 RepID=UPI0004BC9827|nr:LuxR family transcriptional regulator [Cryptosporangium arvum]